MTHILLSRGILAEPHIFKHAKDYISRDNRVVILALSHFKDQFNTQGDYLAFYSKGGEYYEKMINTFQAFNIDEHQVDWIYEGVDDTTSALKKISQADIIYFPGGAPELFMQRINELGCRDAIEAHQGLCIGSSAGAMIQIKNYHISKDSDYKRFSYELGLNLIEDLSIEVHYRRKKVQKSGMRKVFRSYRHPIYVIPDDGALIIANNQIFPINSARLYYSNKGVVK